MRNDAGLSAGVVSQCLTARDRYASLLRGNVDQVFVSGIEAQDDIAVQTTQALGHQLQSDQPGTIQNDRAVEEGKARGALC